MRLRLLILIGIKPLDFLETIKVLLVILIGIKPLEKKRGYNYFTIFYSKLFYHFLKEKQKSRLSLVETGVFNGPTSVEASCRMTRLEASVPSPIETDVPMTQEKVNSATDSAYEMEVPTTIGQGV